jgi:hypothetical protein
MKEEGSGSSMGECKSPRQITRGPEHVNQVATFDVSLCTRFYFKPDDTIAGQGSSIYSTGNERGEHSVIRRAVYCEALTGSFWLGYYAGEETIESNLLVLWHAMRPKADPSKYPLRGMPEILRVDKGSALNSASCKSLFENLGIELHTHTTGHAQAKGSIENIIFLVERHIESLPGLASATSIEDLNAKVQPFVIELNSVTVHPRHKMSRAAAFVSHVREEKLVLPPADYDEFLRLACCGAER